MESIMEEKEPNSLIDVCVHYVVVTTFFILLISSATVIGAMCVWGVRKALEIADVL